MAFQLAKVAVPRVLFAAILYRIDRLLGPPVLAEYREGMARWLMPKREL